MKDRPQDYNSRLERLNSLDREKLNHTVLMIRAKLYDDMLAIDKIDYFDKVFKEEFADIVKHIKE